MQAIKHQRAVLSLCICAGLGAAPTWANHLEARMIGVSDWSAECSANTLTHWDNMVRSWYNEMDNHGWWHRDGSTVDGNLDRDPLCDPDHGTNCNDHNVLDEADATMFFAHGSDRGDSWGAVLRRDGGPSVNDCWIDAPNASNVGDLFAGDNDLEFLHLSSCHGLDKDNLGNAWRMLQDPTDSPGNGHYGHQVTSFHGWMWITSSLDDDYEDFADDAHSVSIKEAWMDQMYKPDISGSDDQCPVAYAVGANSSDCFNRIDHERYNNVYSDPSGIGYYCYYYYAGCNPGGEGPF